MAAKNYTEILELVNAGNQMGLSNTIKRDYGIPLDFTSVQPSYNDAVVYAATNTKAYVGQPLSVGGKLYIINDVAAETKVKVGEVEYDNYLVEVGSATEGDGVTIDLEEGVLTLHGFESALAGYLPRKAEDGSLEWVPISAVVQGDGNKVTTLTSEDGSVTITKKTDTDESLVYDLSVEVYDDTALAARVKTIEDDYLKAEDKYDDTDLQNRVKAIEDDYLKTEDKYDDTALAARVKALEDEERYDDTELSNRVSGLETVVGDTDSGLVKGLADVEAALALKAAQADLEALEDRVDAFLTGTGATDALDSLQELITYINTHDDADINGILASIQAIENKLVGVDTTVADYVTAAINALQIGDYAKAADLTALAGRVATLEAKPFDTYATKTEVNNVDAKFADYYTKTEVDNKGYAVAEEVANTYATKQELTDLGNTLNTTLADYAKTEDVNASLATKIETAIISHSSTEKAEGVTKNGTQLDIVIDAFTKQEVRDYVADAIETMTGGESAADVLLALNNHIADYEEKIGQIDAKDKNQDDAIATADGKGAQGIADAAAAKEIANAAKSQAETNKTDITTILGRLGNVETASGKNATDIGVLNGQVNSLIAEDQAINGQLGTIAGQIVALQGADETINGALALKADASKVYTKEEADAKIQEVVDAIPEVDFTPYLKKADAETTYATIVALETEIARADAAEKANAKAIADLEAGAVKSNTEAIAALDATLKAAIENDGEGLDSIKELATWIETHGPEAKAMAEAITAIETKVDTGDQKVSEYIAAQIAAIPAYDLPAATADILGGVKLSAEVGVNDNSQLEVKTLSTDKLVQGTEELILFGGNSGIQSAE